MITRILLAAAVGFIQFSILIAPDDAKHSKAFGWFAISAIFFAIATL